MQIRVYAALRDITGGARFEVSLPEPISVGAVLQAFAAQHPGLAPKLWDEQGGLKRGFMFVMVNGRAIDFLQGLATPISDADTLSLLPPAGGG